MFAAIAAILFGILLILQGRLPYGFWSDTQWFIVHPAWARVGGVLLIVAAVLGMIWPADAINLPQGLFGVSVLCVVIGIGAELLRLGKRSNDPAVADKIIEDFERDKAEREDRDG